MAIWPGRSWHRGEADGRARVGPARGQRRRRRRRKRAGRRAQGLGRRGQSVGGTSAPVGDHARVVAHGELARRARHARRREARVCLEPRRDGATEAAVGPALAELPRGRRGGVGRGHVGVCVPYAGVCAICGIGPLPRESRGWGGPC
eukprot:990645-Prymnesium_polylepis.1